MSKSSPRGTLDPLRESDLGPRSDATADGLRPVWETRFFGLMNPVQLEIVEAVSYIGEPVSAKVLGEVFEHRYRLNNLSYHVRKLNEAGVFRPAGTARRRGAIEHFYELAD